MTLPRVLEPEVMDGHEEARDYDEMDHGAVNAAFCADLLRLDPDLSRTLDVGTGTARIPTELCRRAPGARVVGIHLSTAMLALGRRNVELCGLLGVVSLEVADAKMLRFEDKSFHCAMSNSILHHVPEPRAALAEMRRVLAPKGILFVRDLRRPASEAALLALVKEHAAEASPRQRGLFEASLRAALSVEELQEIAGEIGIDPAGVTATSDRHVTLVHRAS